MGECESWTSTFPSELPFWELESWWTPKFSKNDFKHQNPWDWEVPYIIGKILERKCLKWVCMTHSDIWNTSYGQRNGWKSIWLPTTKNWESPWLPCMQVACDITLESSQQGLQICFRLHLNQSYTQKFICL
jgi:hypothetical protein